MSSIISVKLNFRNGQVTSQQLAQIWKNYSPETQSKLISILERFEIAFRLRDKTTLFLPSLLPEEKPEHVRTILRISHLDKNLWPKYPDGAHHQMGRIYQFAFVPLGFFPRLMSRFIQQFSDVEIVLLWRNGILIRRTSETVSETEITS